MMNEVIFFESPGAWRDWLAANHQSASELVLGFRKKGSGKTGISYKEAVDEALCYGWIDGVRKRIDDSSYLIRFSPRKPSSIWSAFNIKRVEELRAEGRMQPSGIAAFEDRREDRSRIYSFEVGPKELEPEMEARFRAHPKAWDFFQSQPPSYRQPAIWWVISAKKEETRQRRFERLLADSAEGKRLDHLTPRR
ncbi:MAG TPA: YdeI/OmpD-associated family protein [Thermomicrobiaceae bacterium]|nr:YdeI/OmpD-associated family protein [Thermomicrobiaceae bacterium]